MVWELPENEIFEIRTTPDGSGGRGVYSRKRLKAGSHILTTRPELSPVAHVVLKIYRKEVCAWCFAYDRGREWKTRHHGFAFCNSSNNNSEENCYDKWLDQNKSRLKVYEELALALQRQAKQKQQQKQKPPTGNKNTPHPPLSFSSLSSPSPFSSFSSSSSSSTSPCPSPAISSSASSSTSSLSPLSGPLDPDIVNFLLSDNGHESLMSLVSDPDVYKQKSELIETVPEEEYVKAYQFLVRANKNNELSLSAQRCHEVVARAAHNAFSIRPTNDGDQTGEFLGYGVWPEASFFNHSCRPNVRKAREGRLWSFSVEGDQNQKNQGQDFAVEAGQELCITYLGGDEKELTVQERRKRLQDEWGFHCACPRCVEEGGP